MSKLSLICIYLRRVPVIVILKIRYWKRLQINCGQRFGKRLSLKIQGNARVSISRGLHSWDGLSIRVESGELSIGKHCFFNSNVSLTCLNKIIIGERCSFANNVVIVDHDHDYKNLTNTLFISSPVIIGNNVWVGANSVILRGTTIGDNCVIAASSIVKGTIPDNTLYYQEMVTNLKAIKE